MIDYRKFFSDALRKIRSEDRYRIFAELSRMCGNYPKARLHQGDRCRDVTVWCSNDYLAMAQHPAVLAAMHQAIDEVGAGSGGTRNISGTTHYHVALERELGELHGKEAALLFGSGFIANEATLSTMGRLLFVGANMVGWLAMAASAVLVGWAIRWLWLSLTGG